MQQTFADMLEAEKTRFGRLLIWSRTLTDLPLSAAKEHITNGKEILMNRNTKLIIAGALIAIVIVGLASFWKGILQARNNIGIERVTTSQLADAMQRDDFYSTYGNDAVLFSGKVASVKTQNNASLVTFDTGRPYNVVCQFPKAVSFTNGRIISVAAPTGSAERLAHGVLLHNCLQN
ncbi:MAG: hypothetical protein ACHQT9_04180 [Candidatus Saccharimonadales bacterium]